MIFNSLEKEDASIEKLSEAKAVAPIAAPKIEKNASAPAVAAPASAPVAAAVVQPVVSAVGTTPATAAGKFAAGLLSLKLIETRNLKLPEGCGVLPGGANGKDVGFLPFAVIEMDKNEVIMRAIEANPAQNSVIFGTKANL